METLQTTHEESQNIIRSQRVRDPAVELIVRVLACLASQEKTPENLR